VCAPAREASAPRRGARCGAAAASEPHASPPWRGAASRQAVLALLLCTAARPEQPAACAHARAGACIAPGCRCFWLLLLSHAHAQHNTPG
jgi:uncharacterized protein (DUF58 family)